MILGFDHLALSVSDIELAKKNLEMTGFNCGFLEKNVTNHPEKKILLHDYSNSHNIAFFRREPPNLSLEIIAYDKIYNSSKGVYNYHDSYIQLDTNDIQTEKSFWLNALGFTETESDCLEFVSFIHHWSCKIKLNYIPHLQPYKLDSYGYTCLALLTNNLKKNREKLAICGARDITNEFEITVNNNKLNIVMFRTPTGAICELIKVKRG
jgi:hypothetical protein